MSLIETITKENQTIILDGGLGSELERRGYNVKDPLWSANLLLEDPDAIRDIHLDYLKAGTDCLITATYQATFQALLARGLDQAKCESVFDLAVKVAEDAIKEYADSQPARERPINPFIAASIGPYGAYLSNGAEYTGDYGENGTVEALINFHRERWHYLAKKVNLFACETIPNFFEAQAYAELLKETPHVSAWFSFTCRNEREVVDGTDIKQYVTLLEPLKQIEAIGINCTEPQYVPALIKAIGSVSSKPIVVYPNSGEQYDALEKTWAKDPEADPDRFGSAAKEWRKMGAMLVGGCCRTTPAHIQAISGRIRAKPSASA